MHSNYVSIILEGARLCKTMSLEPLGQAISVVGLTKFIERLSKAGEMTRFFSYLCDVLRLQYTVISGPTGDLNGNIALTVFAVLFALCSHNLRIFQARKQDFTTDSECNDNWMRRLKAVPIDLPAAT
jgi:hypothetical protein